MFNLSTVMMLVGVLLSVAFFTLLERKLMGLAHFRKGPNKVVLSGVSQPISDAVKLISKESLKMSFTKTSMLSLGPLIAMVIMLILWGAYEPMFSQMSKSTMTLLLIVALMSLSPHVFLLMGWGSNSKYTIMGALRAIAQVVSYEVCLVILLLSIMYTNKTYGTLPLMEMQASMWMAVVNIPLFSWWMVMSMAETNRTPFDHAESESELVSGFNVEYGGGLFAVIFISEYGMIMFLSYITSVLFMSGSYMLVKTMMICSLFILVRCAFPRVRYDKLMMMSWKTFLPYSLAMLSLYV